MITAGIDIGSRFIKFVALQNGQVIHKTRVDTGYNPKQTCELLLEQTRPQCYTVTGYGRQLFHQESSAQIITEIKAVALDAYDIMPICRTIVDIGGQDTKVISLTPSGRISSFEMNDRCAAGTGRFLEVMAKNLGYTLEELGTLQSHDNIFINSQCTVFAESEVISLIARGTKRQAIGCAIQNLIASRVASLAKSQKLEQAILFTGGCAHNPYLKKTLEHHIGQILHTLPQSPVLAAYGAALHALQSQ